MSIFQALSFMLELATRTFQMVYMVAMCVVPTDNAEAHATLEENRRWFDMQLAEVKTQMMIDDLYRSEL